MITIAVERAESHFIHELKAIDITTNCPIPYHTLRLHPHNKVILANEDGSVFIDTTQISSSDSLTISCLGYSPKTILIDSINSTTQANRQSRFAFFASTMSHIKIR